MGSGSSKTLKDLKDHYVENCGNPPLSEEEWKSWVEDTQEFISFLKTNTKDEDLQSVIKLIKCLTTQERQRLKNLAGVPKGRAVETARLASYTEHLIPKIEEKISGGAYEILNQLKKFGDVEKYRNIQQGKGPPQVAGWIPERVGTEKTNPFLKKQRWGKKKSRGRKVRRSRRRRVKSRRRNLKSRRRRHIKNS